MTSISSASSAIESTSCIKAAPSRAERRPRSSATGKSRTSISPMPEPLLRVQSLSGGYGRSRVLFGVSFEVPAKGVVAVLGRNGAGKTTLLRTLLGYLKPTSGTVCLEGDDITGLAPSKLVRRGVGY